MLKQKQIILAILAVLIFVLGAAGFFLLQNQKNNPTASNNQEAETTQANKDNSAMNTLVGLLKSGQNTTCTFDLTNEDSGATSGTVYISSNNMRGDFVTTVDGKKTNMSMIRNGNDNYVWGDEMETGIKMTLSEEDLMDDTKTSQYYDLNKEVNYKCTPWSVDASKFIPPTNIKFTDLTGFMQESKDMMKKVPTTADNDGDDSSPCAQITDPAAKSACESALDQMGQ